MIEIRRNNRRRFARAHVDIPVRTEDVGGATVVHAMDDSEWGLRFHTLAGTPVARRGEVYVEFTLPDDTQPIRASGCIASDREVRVTRMTSIRFTLLRDEDAARIRGYVERTRQAA